MIHGLKGKRCGSCMKGDKMKGFLQFVGPDGDTIYMNLERIVAITDAGEKGTKIRFDIGGGKSTTVELELSVEEIINIIKGE